jgi:dipeptidyl-peptidase-4
MTPSAKNIFKKLVPTHPEFHAFEADDGLKLPAMMSKPNDFDPQKKYPAIIYVYGGPGSQQVVDGWRGSWWLWWRLWPSLLNQEGFITFVLEVRAGMGKNKALETSVYKQAYGMQNVKDILAGVRWIKQMPYIDPEKIGLWGWSGGGCTTLYTMTHSDVFKAAISVAPVSDWHFYDTIYTERYQSTPQDNPEGYKDTSSVLAASNLKGHLLIIHGSYDDNVHPQNTYAFVDKLISHGIEFEMMIYPWRKHGIRDLPARIHHFSLMLDFWRRNLKE